MNFACLKPIHVHGNFIICKIFLVPLIVCFIHLPLNLFEYQPSNPNVISTNILAIPHRHTALSRLQLQQKPAVTHKLQYYNRLPQCRIIILCQYRLLPELGAIHLSLFTFRRRKMYLCKQSNTLLDCLHKCMKTYCTKSACTNCLPDDEPMRFETCRRRQKSN